MPIFFKKRHLLAKIMVILTAIVLAPCFASGYSVSYDYYVYGEYQGDINTAFSEAATLDDIASVSNEVTQYGNNGNYGTLSAMQILQPEGSGRMRMSRAMTVTIGGLPRALIKSVFRHVNVDG